MADGDIFSSLHLTGEDGSLTVEDAHQKVVAQTNNSLTTGNDMFSTIIGNNFVSSTDFNRSINDVSLFTNIHYNDESLIYANADLSGQTNSSTALTWNGTSTNPTGTSGDGANTNNLLPFINTAQSVSCIASDYVPNTDYQLTDYTLFQSVIQNTIFEGFGAYSTTQGFQQNLVNLVLTDDSQLYGGYNFGTSSRLPLIMFDVTRQFLNTKLGLRWTANVHAPGDSSYQAAGNGSDANHRKYDGTSYVADPSAERLTKALGQTALLKNYKAAVWNGYTASYTDLHGPENLTANYLKGPDSNDARGPNTCQHYIQQITEEGSQNAAHGENDYIEITMEEVRRELFKTLACPELFGQIFYDQMAVGWTNGPSGALDNEKEFEYDQNDVNTWKGGQIRISNINEARLWLLQYRNWLIHKLTTHRVYNRVQKNSHPLLRDVDNVEHFFYNLDSFTIALITGGASLPDLYANVLDVHQKIQFPTDDNDTTGNPLNRCGLLSNNDFLRWAHIGSNTTITTSDTIANTAVVDGGSITGNGNISGIYWEQQTLGYGQQIGGSDKLFGMKTVADGAVEAALKTVASIGAAPTGQAKMRYQYRNSDAVKTDPSISEVNFNPNTTEFKSGSTITSYTYEPDLENNWWDDEICAGITREWVLPVNAKLDNPDLLGVVANNEYYTSGSDSADSLLHISTPVTSKIGAHTYTATGRGNPGFLTNDVFNVSNWAWAKYVTGGHKPESDNHGDGNGASHRNIDDFIVDLTITARNETLLKVTTESNTNIMNDTVHPKIQDPRQVTRTLCHNAFGASIKILDPIRQLHDACGSGHAWLATSNGHLIKQGSDNSPQVIDRRLGFGFCLGDLISVGQSHHFNLGSRITTGTKKRASIRKGNKHVQLPVEFNAVVNCEFALMFNVVDRCTDIVNTRYTSGSGQHESEVRDALLELGGGLSNHHAEQPTLYLEFGNDTYQIGSTDDPSYCDLRGDLFNDVYNLSLLYLARNESSSLDHFNVNLTPVETFSEEEGGDITKSDGSPATSRLLHDTDGSERCFRHILNATKDGPNDDTQRYGAVRATGALGSNLIFSEGGGVYRYPSQEDATAIAHFYNDNEAGAGNPITVNSAKDILNLWWDYIRSESPTLVVTRAGNLYSEIYKTITTSNDALPSVVTPNPDNLVKCHLWVPVWNTAVLRQASVLDDEVLRGNTILPIDPDLQSGAMIGVHQIVTTENSITGQVDFQSQPNPLLFSTDGTPNGSIGDRIIPHATLNQGSIANGPQGTMVDAEAPETGNNTLNETDAFVAVGAP